MVVIRYFMFLLLFTTSAYSSEYNELFHRNYWYPTFNNEKLNYCSVGGKQCGLVVADRYCQLMGYAKASHEMIAYNVGLTHFLLSRLQCKGWGCNGFMLITCEGDLGQQKQAGYHYRLERFVFPRYDHYRVDWCYKKGAGCGRRAAFSFCRRMGFMKTKGFKKQVNVPATKDLGNHELCFGNQCNGFSEITCYR